MKRIMLLVLCIVTVFSMTMNIPAREMGDSETYVVAGIQMKIQTINHDDYSVIKTEDSEGNKASYDTRDDFIIENGKKIYVILKKETTDIESNQDGISSREKTDWRKIRTSTHTIKFERAVTNISIAAITAYIKPIYSIGYAAVSEIAQYIKNKYKIGSLKNKKIVYIRTDVYGYIYTISREGYKKYSLDANKKKIGGTTTYSDPSMKGL